MEDAVVRAVTHDLSEAKVTVSGVPDRPGVAARLFRTLADRSIDVDMIVQNTSENGATNISFTVGHDALALSLELAEGLVPQLGAEKVTAKSDIAQVSVIGAGMQFASAMSLPRPRPNVRCRCFTMRLNWVWPKPIFRRPPLLGGEVDLGNDIVGQESAVAG